MGTAAAARPSRRRDIQGLRALAALAVVGFHGALPLPGGFVGVDAFFVISGFVITAMLQREHAEHGRIRLGAFFRRRFARLTPALGLVVASTVAVGWLVLPPLGAQQTAARTGLGAMGLVANLVIASSSGDYFALPAESNPLLHTWSLSVEEQFYLVFPLLLAGAWWLVRRRGWKRAPLVALCSLAALSFTASLWGAAGPPVAGARFVFGFYGAGARAWEFAVGALLALVDARLASTRAATLAGAAGAIGFAISMRAITGATPFPGVWALLPVVSTALLLLAGTVDGNPISRVLSSATLVRLGDRSYAIYLWHWPLIVFARQIWPESRVAAPIAAAVSLLPAFVSYRWVEQRLRHRVDLHGRRLALAVAVAVVVPMSAAGGAELVADRVLRPRYESGAMPVSHDGELGQAALFRHLETTYVHCTPVDIYEHAVEAEGVHRCHQSRAGSPDVVLFGDSHAEHLFTGLAEALPDHNVAYFIRGDLPVRDNPLVGRMLDRIVSDPAIHTVVLTAYWRLRGVPVDKLRTTLRELTAAGKQVFLTDDVPSFPFDPFRCKYRSALLLPAQCTDDADYVWSRYDEWGPPLRALAAGLPGVRLIETLGTLCGPQHCTMIRDGRLLYRDNHHLNRNGSRLVARVLLADPAFRAALDRPD